MAETHHASPTKTQAIEPQRIFSLEIPVSLRMSVGAADVDEATEIIIALCGNGQWLNAGQVGRGFAIKTE